MNGKLSPNSGSCQSAQITSQWDTGRQMEAGAAPLRAHTCRSENPAGVALTRVAALGIEGALAVPYQREGALVW